MAALPKDLVRRAAARRHRADPICGRRFSMSDKKAPTPNQLRNSNRMKLGVFGTIDVVEAAAPELVSNGHFTSDTTGRSEEHTSELQSLMRISYAVFCLKKKKNNSNERHNI